MEHPLIYYRLLYASINIIVTIIRVLHRRRIGNRIYEMPKKQKMCTNATRHCSANWHFTTRRSSVKKLLKSAKLESQKRRFDIQQKALKLVANSMYGCLGFEHSRLY
eukprot:241901_1